MSELVKNSDVEDVLFSIRRLVSDTPETDSAATAQDTNDGVEEDTTEKEAAKIGALFLTTALRVNDPATEPEQIDLEDMTSDFSHFRDAVGRDDVQATELPSLEDVFAANSDDDAPRRLHLSEIAGTASVDPAPTMDDFEDEDTDTLAERKWTDDPDVETLGDFATPNDTFGEPVEEPVVEADEETAITDQAEAAAHNDTLETPAIETDGEADDAPDQQNDSEIHVEDAAPEDVETAEDTTETVEAGAADGLADFDENILDEDALRDMVTEIVRQELSGELGERITRNVRKLVRREIHRALMTREFD